MGGRRNRNTRFNNPFCFQSVCVQMFLNFWKFLDIFESLKVVRTFERSRGSEVGPWLDLGVPKLGPGP